MFGFVWSLQSGLSQMFFMRQKKHHLCTALTRISFFVVPATVTVDCYHLHHLLNVSDLNTSTVFRSQISIRIDAVLKMPSP